MLCRKQHAENGLNASKSYLKVEDKEYPGALKKFEVEELKHYFMKTHVRLKMNLQNY